jgi:hypothetical protein
MSYPQSVKDQFLALRADGLSYAQCAKQLQVSRHTLIIWAKELKPHLDALRAIRTEELLEQVQLRLEERIILLAGFYHKVCQTIENASLLAPGIPRLFTLLLKLNSALDKYEMASASPPLTARLASRAEPSIENTPQIPDTDSQKIEPPQNVEPEPEKSCSQPLANAELEKTEPKLNHPEVSSLPIQSLSPAPTGDPKSKIQNHTPPSAHDLQKLNKIMDRIDRAEAKIDRRAS